MVSISQGPVGSVPFRLIEFQLYLRAGSWPSGCSCLRGNRQEVADYSAERRVRCTVEAHQKFCSMVTEGARYPHPKRWEWLLGAVGFALNLEI